MFKRPKPDFKNEEDKTSLSAEQIMVEIDEINALMKKAFEITKPLPSFIVKTQPITRKVRNPKDGRLIDIKMTKPKF